MKEAHKVAVSKVAARKIRKEEAADHVSVQTIKKKGEVKMADEKAAEKAGKTEAQVSSKSRMVALLLCFFLGWAGGHRFYTNKVGTGLMMLFTMGGFGMWYFLDFVMIASGNFKDNANLPLANWK